MVKVTLRAARVADCEAVGVIVAEAEAARQWEYLLALDNRYSLNGSRG